MHFWGLTIDVVSAVNVIIAIGLCVDYSGLIKISKMYSWKPGIDFMKRTVPFSSIPDRPHRIILLQIFIHLSDKIDFVCRNILSGIIRQLQQQNNKQNFIQIFNVKLLFIANFASSSWLSLFQCTSATPSWQCPAQRGKELTRPWWASLAKLSEFWLDQLHQ